MTDELKTTIIFAIVVGGAVVIVTKAIEWMLTDFSDWWPAHVRFPWQRVEEALPYHPPPYKGHHHKTQKRGHKTPHPIDDPATTDDPSSGQPVSTKEFILVQERVIVVLWALVTVGIPVSIIEIGLSHSNPTLYPNDTIFTQPQVTRLIIAVGVILTVAGVLWTVAMWRWRLVVDRHGLELRPGLGKPHALTFRDIEKITTARWSLTPTQTLSLWGKDGKLITKVPGSCKSYPLFLDQLATARPELIPKATD